MLKDLLYTIISISRLDDAIHSVLKINEHHEILNGHFPGQPVLPGACMLQMVKEVLEEVIGKSLQMKVGSNLKFLQVIDPRKNNSIQLNITYKLTDSTDIQVTASITCDESICFKFQGTFI